MGFNLSVFFQGLDSSKSIINRSAHNTANINTRAFKATNSLTGTTDFTISSFSFSGNSLDLSISGRGFFKVIDTNGRELYSRKGDFSFDNEGNIVDSKGYKLDVDFKLDPNQPFAIDRNGSVFQNGREAGRIEVFDLSGKQQLVKENGGYFQGSKNPVQINNSVILSGNQELSNTDIPLEQVSQIMGKVSYEANIKGIKVMDELLGETLDLKS
jgi:flagellar basal-body rod protein FlgG